MKLSYTWEDVERWRDRVHRRLPTTSIKNKKQALDFVNRVGYCFAFKSDTVELPSLWQAVTGFRHGERDVPPRRDYYLSYAWAIRDILPETGAIFYGKVIRRRPSVISLEYLPYFYVLMERSGHREEYQTEFARGRLSKTAKGIMDALSKRSPLATRELKIAVFQNEKKAAGGFDKAINELQARMFVTRVVDHDRSRSAEWASVRKYFAAQVRIAGTISMEAAREKILEKYFQNQLITSVDAIHRLFRWPRQIVYRTLGQLVHKGVITANVKLDGKNSKYYCLVH